MKCSKFLFVLFFLGVGLTEVSAAPAPPIGGGSPTCWPPPCIPIDGGISILVAAGALYGLRRLKSPSQEKLD
jgi:hypothetical protein